MVTNLSILYLIDNTGLINYDQLYAQLYAELEQGRRYWFEDEENARIMQQNLELSLRTIIFVMSEVCQKRWVKNQKV